MGLQNLGPWFDSTCPCQEKSVTFVAVFSWQCVLWTEQRSRIALARRQTVGSTARSRTEKLPLSFSEREADVSLDSPRAPANKKLLTNEKVARQSIWIM